MKISINKVCILFCFLLIGLTASAQQLNMDVRDFDGNMQVYDPANPRAGKGGTLAYAEVEGTAFWDEKWNPAILFFAGGGKAKINQARLNLYSNEIHYLSSDGTELAVENEGVTRLVFVNKNNLTQPIASFAKLINHTTENGTAFYKVLNAGLYQLILLQKQLIKTSPYDPIQGKSISSFYTKKEYAIYNEGKVVGLRDLDRTSVLTATPSNDLTTEWLKGNKTKLKSEKEVVDYLEQVNLILGKSGNK
jgi:hypothetical protein